MSSTLPEELPDGGYELSCDWLLNPSRPREAIFGDGDKDRICRMVEEYEENPLEESHFFSKRRAKEIDDIWRHWQKYASLTGRDPDQVWVDVCTGREGTAKPYFQAFLRRYVEASITLRPCLGPKEWEKIQTIRCAVTLEDVWSTLVAAANINVIKPRRQREPWNAQFIALSYSSQKKQSQNATIRDIGRWIGGEAAKFDLRLDQTFEKVEMTTGDVLLWLDTLWTRAMDIPWSPSARLGAHTCVVFIGIGGWRSASILGLSYKDVEIAHVRHPRNPLEICLVATITIYHVKQQKNRIRRDQRNKLKFSITFVPCKLLCLLTLLLSRAIADDAFFEGYRTIEELLPSGHQLRDGVDFSAIKWRDEVLEKPIVPVSYHQYRDIWNMTLFVAGMLRNPRSYSMRVGTAGRLDGQLTPALRNFILSHSTGVYETSYHPVQVREGLMKVSFGDLAGENDELLGIMRNACLRRDPWAPIYITKLDLDNFEKRRDLSQLRARLQSVAPKSKEKEKITGRIQYIRNSLEKLLIEERRREYFENLQQGKSTTHLVNLSATNPRPKVHRASSLVAGCLARFFVDDTSHTALSKKLVKYLRGLSLEGSPKLDADRAVVTEAESGARALPRPRCLLCDCPDFHNKSSLSRHVWDCHKDKFGSQFLCPECHRLGKGEVQVEAGRQAWSSHVSRCHDTINAPNPISAKTAYCLLCSTHFTPKGFNAHLNRRHLVQFSQPLPCPECSRQGHNCQIQGQDAWVFHVREAHDGGWGVPGAVMTDRREEGGSNYQPPIKRKQEIVVQRQYKRVKGCGLTKWELDGGIKGKGDHHQEEFWVTGRDEDYV